jgi:hypothetical protein
MASTRQDDWSVWLPLASAVHNAQTNATTGVRPIQAILGYLPHLTNHAQQLSTNPLTEEQKEQAEKFRAQAKKVLNKTAQSTPLAQLGTDMDDTVASSIDTSHAEAHEFELVAASVPDNAGDARTAIAGDSSPGEHNARGDEPSSGDDDDDDSSTGSL